jgi:hypothetical protein
VGELKVMDSYKPYPFNTAFLVSEKGIVWSTNTRRNLSPSVNSKGYSIVTLWNKETHERSTARVHRMVALCFLKPVEGREEVNHKDGNKQNNSAENLEWVNRKEQMEHASRIGLIWWKGDANPRAKLTSIDVEIIRERRSKGETLESIANDYPVSTTTISAIVRRKKWAT